MISNSKKISFNIFLKNFKGLFISGFTRQVIPKCGSCLVKSFITINFLSIRSGSNDIHKYCSFAHHSCPVFDSTHVDLKFNYTIRKVYVFKKQFDKHYTSLNLKVCIGPNKNEVIKYFQNFAFQHFKTM